MRTRNHGAFGVLASLLAAVLLAAASARALIDFDFEQRSFVEPGRIAAGHAGVSGPGLAPQSGTA